MKLLLILGLGLVAVVAVDGLLGIKFEEDVTRLARVAHNLAYMAWGGLLMLCMRSLQR